MFDEIKKALDEIEKMQLEVVRRERDLVRKLGKEYGVIGIQNIGGDYTAQVHKLDRFMDIADGGEVNVVMREDDYYPYELEIILEDVTFFTLLSKDDYELYVEKYENDKKQEYGPEEARARLTEYERGLRDSGHEQSDFL